MHPVFEVLELVRLILRHDTRGRFRRVSRWLKQEWDSVHGAADVFKYEMLLRPKSPAVARVCLAHAKRAWQGSDEMALWSVPVPSAHVCGMNRMMWHQYRIDLRMEERLGWAQLYLAPMQGRVLTRLDVVQTNFRHNSIAVFSSKSTAVNAAAVTDVARYMCFCDRLSESERGGTEHLPDLFVTVAVHDTRSPFTGMLIVEGAARSDGSILVTRANPQHPFVSSLGGAIYANMVYKFENDGYKHVMRPQKRPQLEIIAAMPPSIDHDKAVAIINDKGLKAVGAKFPGACVFEATDTLQHVPDGPRTLLCVFDKDGNNRTPIDTSRTFHSTDVVVAVNVDRCFMGGSTTCKNDMSMSASKQSAYTQPLQGNAASVQFFKEMMRVYKTETYAAAVEAHAMHAAKQGKLLKGGDALKGIQGLARKNKLHTPIADDDDGNPRDVVMRRKVFSARHAWKETGSDYDNVMGIEQFCEDMGPKTRTGNCCVDPVPIFYADGSRVKQYDSVRGSSAAVVVYSLRGDWVNQDLGNISWPHQVEYMQLLTVTLARGDSVVTAPNLLDDEPTGVEFVPKRARSDSDTEEEDEGEGVEGFVAKRRKQVEN